MKPRELEETLRMEYRSKLLNPRWSEAMVKQGAAGAYEISGRMTALLGWAGTAGAPNSETLTKIVNVLLSTLLE